jgi:hypothetical protein
MWTLEREGRMCDSRRSGKLRVIEGEIEKQRKRDKDVRFIAFLRFDAFTAPESVIFRQGK